MGLAGGGYTGFGMWDSQIGSVTKCAPCVYIHTQKKKREKNNHVSDQGSRLIRDACTTQARKAKGFLVLIVIRYSYPSVSEGELMNEV